MFIRRTKTRTTEDGTQYFSYRLVRNERQGDRVRQRTLLNLGSHFPVEKRHWRLLCARITQLIGRQETLLPLPWPDEVLFFGLNWRGFPEFFRSVRDDSSRFALI